MLLLKSSVYSSFVMTPDLKKPFFDFLNVEYCILEDPRFFDIL
jgi:hypothetical protein